MPANKRVSSVYTHFDILTTGDPYSTDIYAGGKRTVTEGCFTNGDGTIDAYYTASAQFAQSSSYYYINVYDLDPQGSQSSSAEIQFDISYGSYGSYINSANDYETTYEPAQVLYKQYRNILLNSSTDHFTFAGSTTGSDDILIINFKRNRIKEKLDPGN